ncbi:hypothetical protein BWI17_05830 [Betaproteobacteria bacterium GR16-43]|nr:hypothetical protein BWI17_05830 [Betaproteobacteria bacterium GR16-43]
MNAAHSLQGLGVVLTRPVGAANELELELSAAGARVIHFPALDVKPIDASPALDAALAGLAKQDMAIFVSANAARLGLEALRARKIAWPRHVAVAAIGEATAQALRNSGLPEAITPTERFDSEALLERPELQAVAGRNIIVFRGEGGRERLREGLESRGARVTYAECYKRSRPETDPAPLLAAWARGEVQVVGVLSSETLENFVEMIGPEGRAKLSATALVVTHESIARHADAKRFGRVLVSPPGAAALAAAMSQIRETK